MSNARATSTIDLGLPRRSQIGAGPSGVCTAGATEAVGREYLNTVEHWKAKTDEFGHMMLKTIEQNVRADQIITLLMGKLGISHVEFSHEQLNEAPIRHTKTTATESRGAIVATGEQYRPEKITGSFTCAECGRTVQGTFSVNAGQVYCPACAGLEG